jgi:hypothetical protein
VNEQLDEEAMRRKMAILRKNEILKDEGYLTWSNI